MRRRVSARLFVGFAKKNVESGKTVDVRRRKNRNHRRERNLTWIASGTIALTTEASTRSRRGRAGETRVCGIREGDALGMLVHPGSSIFMVWPSKVPLRGEGGGSAGLEREHSYRRAEQRRRPFGGRASEKIEGA